MCDTRRTTARRAMYRGAACIRQVGAAGAAGHRGRTARTRRGWRARARGNRQARSRYGCSWNGHWKPSPQPRPTRWRPSSPGLIPMRRRNGPGAAEARAAHYIDRALTGPLRSSRDAYAAGGLAAIDAYAQSKRGAAFARLSAADQDAVLSDMEKNVATGFRAERQRPSSISCANPHHPGHVLRPLLRLANANFRRLGISSAFPACLASWPWAEVRASA